MTFTRTRLRFLSLLVSIPVTALPPASQRPKAVVISIDGLRGMVLSSLPGRHLDVPHLEEIVKGGSYSTGLIGVFPTVTYPSHTTLVTGVQPDVHGILGNGLFDPEHKLNGAWYYYSEQIKVPTLWTLAKQAGLRTAAVEWPVTVGANVDALIPEARPIRTYEDVMALRAICTPGLLAEFETQTGPLTPQKLDDPLRAQMAAFLIRTRQPDLLLLHLVELDHQEHVHGPDSEEANHALEKIDTAVGLVQKAVKDAGLEKNTVIFIVSDHGFFPVDSTFQPRAVLNSLGLLTPRGETKGWRIGVFQNGSSFGLVANDPNDREGMEMARQTFRTLAADGRLGIEKLYEGEELKSMHGYSNSFLAATLKSNFDVGGKSDGPWVTSSGETKGMHGYAPGPVEMDAAFAAQGPQVKVENLGRRHLVDVAPTVATYLRLSTNGMEGSNLLSH